MANAEEVSRDAINALVISSLRRVLSQKGEPSSDLMKESTHLIGSDSVLDSLGLITLVVDLEERTARFRLSNHLRIISAY